MAKRLKKLSNGQLGDDISTYGEAISQSVRDGKTPIFAFGKENGRRFGVNGAERAKKQQFEFTEDDLKDFKFGDGSNFAGRCVLVCVCVRKIQACMHAHVNTCVCMCMRLLKMFREISSLGVAAILLGGVCLCVCVCV
jgi:hypothetical protein